MRWMKTFLVGLVLLILSMSLLHAGTGRVIKVLPHYLDAKGRHTLHPSLYERDAYQAQLRRNPDEQSGLRFDVQWKARNADPSKLKIRVETRSVQGANVTTRVLEQPVGKQGWFSTWTGLTLSGEEFKQAGQIAAWRATLWEGDTLLGEERSFLW